MKLGAISREAWRNIISGTTHALLYAGLLFILASGLALSEVLTIDALKVEATTFKESGAATVVVSAEGRIDGDVCDSYLEVEGVLASGAIVKTKDTLKLATLPSSPIPIFQATPGFSQLITQARPEGAGIILGEEAASALGASIGVPLSASVGEVQVAGIFPYPSDGRSPGLNFAAVVPTNEKRLFDECWVYSWPMLADLQMMVTTSVISSDNGEGAPAVGQLNPTLGAQFSGPERFAHRITLMALPVSLIASVFAGCFSVVQRRLELASAMHVGVRKADLLAILGIESAVWIVTGSVGALAVVVVAASALSKSQPGAELHYGFLIVTASAVGSFVGVVLGWLAVKERLILKYFKERQ